MTQTSTAEVGNGHCDTYASDGHAEAARVPPREAECHPILERPLTLAERCGEALLQHCWFPRMEEVRTRNTCVVIL